MELSGIFIVEQCPLHHYLLGPYQEGWPFLGQLMIFYIHSFLLWLLGSSKVNSRPTFVT